MLAHHQIDRSLALSGVIFLLTMVLPTATAWSVVQPEKPAAELREAISLTDAVLRALQHNLDITISRQTKESRLTDIIFEQAKFDPLFSFNGQYNRAVSPLNRPVFGLTGQALDVIQTLDQNQYSITLDVTQNLLTGANYDLNFAPSRTFVAGNPTFLFNPGYQSGLAFTLTQPFLRNFGVDVNRTFIRIAQNNAKFEEQVFLDRVLTVIATVEQAFWELVFANENLTVAQAALKAAEELLASNRAKAKAGVMAIVEVLQAEAAVASRVEQTLIAEKAIRDQEDQVRRLLNPSEQELRQDVRLGPLDKPVQSLEPISVEEAIDIAIERRPEVLQASKNIETSEINIKFAKNQLLPNLSFQGTAGGGGPGKDAGGMVPRNFWGGFYKYWGGVVPGESLGQQSAWSQYNKRQLEARNAQASLQRLRQLVIVSVKEAVRRVQTDFKRIETTRSARITSEKQLQAEQERLNVGLSATRFVLA